MTQGCICLRHGPAATSGSLIYLFGGSGWDGALLFDTTESPNPSNEVDIYVPVGDAWSLGPPLTAARRNFPIGSDPVTGTTWAVGGYDVDGLTPLAINEEFTACVVVDDTIFEDGFDGPPPP